MSDPAQRIPCRWCKGQNPASATRCERCGAPLDVRDVVSDSGWRMAPRIRDLTEIPLGGGALQLDGSVVPVAEATLTNGDSIFFEHHVMLWKDSSVAMAVMDSPGGMKRVLAGMPFVLSVAKGAGRVAFSRDAAGELIVLPIDPGVELDVRGHAMLLATTSLTYSFEQVKGLKAMLSVGTGMYLDRFVAQGSPGVLVLHGYGNVFERALGEGETIQVEPGGFLYKDSSVTMDVNTLSLTPEGSNQALQAAKGIASRGLAGIKAARKLMKGEASEGMAAAAGVLTGSGMSLLRLTGPGRVGIQSMYVHRETA